MSKTCKLYYFFVVVIRHTMYVCQRKKNINLFSLKKGSTEVEHLLFIHGIIFKQHKKYYNEDNVCLMK